MRPLEKRIAVLENSVQADELKIVITQVGESIPDALKRLGHPPDTEALFVVFVSPSPQTPDLVD